jgi:hypothetical protein
LWTPPIGLARLNGNLELDSSCADDPARKIASACQVSNRDGLTSSTGKPFTVSMIRWIRYKHRIPGPSLPAGTFSVSQVRERYGVSMWVVYYWIDRGLITAQRKKPGLPYAFEAYNAGRF